MNIDIEKSMIAKTIAINGTKTKLDSTNALPACRLLRFRGVVSNIGPGGVFLRVILGYSLFGSHPMMGLGLYRKRP
jgi:hypothetical protein